MLGGHDRSHLTCKKEDEGLEQEPTEAKPRRVTGMWETTAYVQTKERHEEIKGPDVFCHIHGKHI